MRSEKGFTLLEVLVAVVIVSISLLWSTYILSNALNWRFLLKKERLFLSKLEFYYMQLAVDSAKKEALTEGERVRFQAERVLVVFEPAFFCPFEDVYLNKIQIFNQNPPGFFENLKKIPSTDRQKICLFLIRTSLFEASKKLLAERFYPFSSIIH